MEIIILFQQIEHILLDENGDRPLELVNVLAIDVSMVELSVKPLLRTHKLKPKVLERHEHLLQDDPSSKS